MRDNRKEGATVLNRRSTEAKRLIPEKLARHRLGLEKGLRLARVTGKLESNSCRRGKLQAKLTAAKATDRDGSQRRRRSKAQKLKSRGGRTQDVERHLPREGWRGNKNKVERKPRLGEEKKQRRKSEIPRQRSQETDLSVWKDMQQKSGKERRYLLQESKTKACETGTNQSSRILEKG